MGTNPAELAPIVMIVLYVADKLLLPLLARIFPAKTHPTAAEGATLIANAIHGAERGEDPYAILTATARSPELHALVEGGIAALRAKFFKGAGVLAIFFLVAAAPGCQSVDPATVQAIATDLQRVGGVLTTHAAQDASITGVPAPDIVEAAKVTNAAATALGQLAIVLGAPAPVQTASAVTSK